MRVIGLTGSIACGKTTISSYLAALQYPVIDGDQISRDLTVPGSPVIEEIRRVFGDRFVNDSGSLNRRALGQLIFRDDNARQALDEVMAPYLLRETKAQLDRYAAEGALLCFLDMPLLFEKGYDRFCDSVWSVWLPENVQLSRLMSRDSLNEDDAVRRIRAVMSSDEKASRADHVIDNTGSVQQTIAEVDRLINLELNPPRESPSPPAVFAPAVPASRDVMERPEAARRKPSARRVAWRLPVAVRSALIILTVVLVIGITAFALMSGYLKDREIQHEEEEKSIGEHFPYPSVSYDQMISKYSEQYNLEPAFVYAVILNESSFDKDAVSSVGARGLMQLMPETAEWIASKLSVQGYAFDRMYDPDSNIRFGCWYLNYLSGLFDGDTVSVVAAYHAGQGQVRIWLSDRAVSDDGHALDASQLPDGPTKQYVKKVTEAYGIYQERYFNQVSPDSDGSPDDPFVPDL